MKSDHQVQRGHAGTLKQWRDFVVKPIKQGQRREGMASDVVTSIVSLQSQDRPIAEWSVTLGRHASGNSTPLCY